MQVAYSLGEADDPRVANAIADIVCKHASNEYIVSAAWSSVDRANLGQVTEGVLSRMSESAPSEPLLRSLSALAAALGDDECVRHLLEILAGSRNQIAVLASCLDQLRQHKRLSFGDAAVVDSRLRESITSTARQVAQSRDAGERDTLAAVRILSMMTSDANGLLDLLGKLIGPQSPPAVQQEAARILATSRSTAALDLLFAKWRAYTPAIRSQLVDTLLQQEATCLALLQTIKARTAKSSDLDALQRQRLLIHGSTPVKQLAQECLAGSIESNRQEVVRKFAAEIDPLHGDIAKGRELYRKQCSSCHQLERHGYSVGPDLSALTSQSTQTLLSAILDPNQTTDERYQAYVASTADGLTLTGILTAENSNSITLAEQNGKQHVILRNALDELTNTGRSLMPDGLERDISPAGMADLLAYLASQATPPKSVPGNRPETVRADEQGTIWLAATTCEIYGKEITYEAPLKNIGFWRDRNDHIAWNVDVPIAGEFELYVTWACPEQSSGNLLAIDGGEPALKIVVPGTGGWDKYESRKFGVVKLVAGKNRISARPEIVAPDKYLMDLRGIRLVPAKPENDKESK
jgi:putative heme-binding domain-containing protein